MSLLLSVFIENVSLGYCLIADCLVEKKSETELTASVLKKDKKHTRDEKRVLFNWMRQDKMHKGASVL